MEDRRLKYLKEREIVVKDSPKSFYELKMYYPVGRRSELSSKELALVEKLNFAKRWGKLFYLTIILLKSVKQWLNKTIYPLYFTNISLSKI